MTSNYDLRYRDCADEPTPARAPGTVPALVGRHTIEERSSPVCMGVQRRIVSREGHAGPWVCGKMSDVWKAYKRMRKAANGANLPRSEAE